MTRFHRFTDPTWYGFVSIPNTPGASSAQANGKTYDRINVISGGTGSSGSAPANGPTVGGTNPTTYFIAFGEPAESSAYNRGFRALAENDDYIDDVLHRSIPLPVETAPVTTGSVVTTVTLPKDLYLGPTGTTLSTTEIAKLIRFLDSNGDELIDDTTGAPVRVVSIPGYGTSPADPYTPAAVPSAPLTTSIGVGVTYTMVYGSRSNLTDVPSTAWFYPMRSQFSRTPGYVQNLFRLFQGGGAQWDSAPISDIYSLAKRGLQGVYERALGVTAVGVPYGYPSADNTYGSGAWFCRIGPSMLGFSQMEDYPDLADRFGAIWTASNEDTNTAPGAGNGSSSKAVGMTVGFAYLGGRKSSMTLLDEHAPGVAAAFYAARHRDNASEGDLYTRIVEDQACTISMSGGDILCTLSGTTSFFWNTFGDKRTGVATGFDCLEIAHDTGDIRTYVIVEVTGQYTCKMRTLDGGAPFPALVGNATIRSWIRPYHMVGDGAAQYRYSGTPGADARNNLRGAFFVSPPIIKNGVPHLDSPIAYRTPALYAGAYENSADAIAFQWGGFTYNGTTGTGTYSRVGALRGNGDISVGAIVATGRADLPVAAYHSDAGNDAVGFSWSMATTKTFDFTFTGPGNTITGELTDCVDGGEYYLLIRRSAAQGQTIVLELTVTDFDVAYAGGTPSSTSTPISPAPGFGTNVDIFKILVIGSKAFVSRDSTYTI